MSPERDDKIIPFSRFRADVGKGGAQRLRELLNSRDVTAAVQALDPLELFALAQDVGEGDAIDVVALASDEQVKRVIDLGIGSSSAPDLRYIERWLAAAIAHGHGTATLLFEKLDEDLQTLYLFRRLKVYDARDENWPDDDVERLVTPDGTFVLEVMDDEEPSELDESLPTAANDVPANDNKPFSPLRLIADLYSVDWQRADTMMRDAKWAIAAELEETVVRLRDARLEELGFPPRDDAFKLFSRRGPAAQLKAREGHTAVRHTLPVTYAEPFFADSFFVRVMNAVQDVELVGELENELIYAVNATCVFEERVYSETDSVRAAGRDVRNWISLGLEVLSAGDPEAAAALVRKHPLRELLSLGVEQSHKLADWVRKAESEGLFRLPGLSRRPLNADDERFLKALLGRIPRFVEGPAGEPARAFASRQDLAHAQKRIEGLARQMLALRFVARAAADYAVSLQACEPDIHAVTVDLLLRSALLRATLGASLKDTFGVSPADLRAFHAVVSKDAALPDLEPPPEVVATLHEVWAALVRDVLAAGVEAEPQYLNLIVRKEQG
ncbi:MAG: hypothetical protein IT381_24420 [Deltaproteobacteria bacterium]|nr:hypothetical protein [Deltaproteobacteria bacterium]